MSLETQIDIAAPPSAVYKILMDFNSYPEWNPFVVQISGDPAVGNKIEVHVKSGSRKPMKFKPVVLKNEENKEFRWVGELLASFLYRGEHYFIIEETENGTRFRHGENFSGILNGVLNAIIGDDTKKSFEVYNAAIKERAEKSTAS